MSSKAKHPELDIQKDQEKLLVDGDSEFLLPELLETILTKAALVKMYSEDMAKRQSDESIFNNLASVDFLWWDSMKTRRFRNKILRVSKVYYQKTKMRSKIVRNNENFLKEVIDPDKIIFLMESCGCLTEEQVRFLNRLRNRKDKNHELLIMLQDFSSQKYSKMIDCLFLANQTPAGLVLERGGEAVKLHISNGNATKTREFEMEIIERFHRLQTEYMLLFNDLLNVSFDKRLNDILILHAKQNEGIGIWFWCKTESSLKQLKSLSEDDLREIIQRIYQQLIPERSTSIEPQLIKMDYTLASDFDERRFSIRHVAKLEDGINDFEFFQRLKFSPCVTSLADKIYVVQMAEILVYKNVYPFQALEPIVFDDKGAPISIASCSINKCLYIAFHQKNHIFKVESEFDNRISAWLREIGTFVISVTCKGDVLVLQIENGNAANELRIFTDEGTVKRTISMKYRLCQTHFIQEIMPDIVALNYDKPYGFGISCLLIMRLDDNGTILRNIEFQEKVFDISSFRYGDMLIGVCGYDFLVDQGYRPPVAQSFDEAILYLDNDVIDIELGYDGKQTVQLHHWSFGSIVSRSLSTTDKKIYCLYFAADQKQLYVLHDFRLDIYQLNYEDEDYDR